MNIEEILKRHNLGTKFTFIESKESSATTSWGIEWDELFIARDVIQNFYDANKEAIEEIKIEIANNHTITVSAPAMFNIKKLFYFGSEKTEDDVGQYGEGFKAACVCLLRDFNINPIAVSGDYIYFIQLADTPVEDTSMYPLVVSSHFLREK